MLGGASPFDKHPVECWLFSWWDLVVLCSQMNQSLCMLLLFVGGHLGDPVLDVVAAELARFCCAQDFLSAVACEGLAESGLWCDGQFGSTCPLAVRR